MRRIQTPRQEIIDELSCMRAQQLLTRSRRRLVQIVLGYQALVHQAPPRLPILLEGKRVVRRQRQIGMLAVVGAEGHGLF